MGEGNGGSGLGGVDGGVDGASVDPSGVDIGSDEGLELRLAGRGDRADTANMICLTMRIGQPPKKSARHASRDVGPA